MSPRHAGQQANPFLTAPVGRLFMSNALPMAVVMSMGGVLNVVDGIFIGRFIGSDALAAASLSFPAAMLLSALTALVGGGMSSLMARALGAQERAAAGRIFARAHGLALAISAGLVVIWALVGPALVVPMAAGNQKLAGLAQEYLRILILGAPVQLLLGIHADALRNEGRAGLVALLSALVNLFNIGANWLGIVVLDLGISASALGTVAAQALGLALMVGIRSRAETLVPLSALRRQSWRTGWFQIIRLGLPLCLSFVGLAMVASIVILTLRRVAGAEYDTLVAGYGIVTRLLGLAFLPQLAVALATQSIVGNNAGAGRSDRALAVLRLALGTAFLWCLTVALIGFLAGANLGHWFSDDPAVIASVATILRKMLLLYASSGPILVLALYFQALGQSGRTAVLTLVKPWLLTPLLIPTLAACCEVSGIWLAFPTADMITLGLALLIGRTAFDPAAISATTTGERT